MEYDFYVFYLNSNLHDSYKNAVSEHLEMVKLSKKNFLGAPPPNPKPLQLEGAYSTPKDAHAVSQK